MLHVETNQNEFSARKPQKPRDVTSCEQTRPCVRKACVHCQ